MDYNNDAVLGSVIIILENLLLKGSIFIEHVLQGDCMM